MSSIHQRLQLFRRSEPTRSRKERSHLITENELEIVKFVTEWFQSNTISTLRKIHTKKTCMHCIPETCVIGMFHNGHELYGIVTQVFDAREHILGKFRVRSDSRLLRGNSNVRLIDPEGLNNKSTLKKVILQKHKKSYITET